MITLRQLVEQVEFFSLKMYGTVCEVLPMKTIDAYAPRVSTPRENDVFAM